MSQCGKGYVAGVSTRLAAVVLAAAALLLSACASSPDLSSMQWRECASPTRASLRGLCPLDARVAFVCGSGGLVLRTRDGGRSWEPCGPRGVTGLDFRALVALDAEHLLLANAGAPARVYASGDGGDSWSVVHEDLRPGAFFDSLAFDASGRGFLFGDPVEGRLTLLASADAGQTWRDLGAQLPPPVPGEAGFAASNGLIALPSLRGLCVVTGGTATRALLSLDNGASWHAAELPLRHGQASQGAFAVAFANALHGVAIGGDYAVPADADGTAATTMDGGVTWQPATVPPAGYRSAVTAVPGGGATFLAVGPTGGSITDDGGRTWRPFGELGFHTVRAAADGSIWAAGSGGRIARLVPR